MKGLKNKIIVNYIDEYGTKEELQQQVRTGTEKLESIFLQLTGGEEMSQIIESLKQ